MKVRYTCDTCGQEYSKEELKGEKHRKREGTGCNGKIVKIAENSGEIVAIYDSNSIEV